MRLEYFQMIDRFVDVDVGGATCRGRSAHVPTESPVFEGHFPGYPLMPGVLLIECMAQTTGWLVSALTGFTGMPVLAGVKEAQNPHAVFPGDELEFEGRIIHEGSGYAVGEAKGMVQGRRDLRRHVDLPHRSLSEPGISRRIVGVGRAHQLPGQGVREVTDGARCGSPASAFSPAWARGSKQPGQHLERGDPPPYDDKSFAPYIVHPLRADELRQADPEEERSAADGDVAARRRLFRGAGARPMPAIAGNAELLDHTDMIVAAGGGERDIAVDTAIMAGVRKTNAARRLSQRTADERSAPDLVPGAAAEPAGRQYFARAWRGRLLAHFHGRGSPPASMPCA